MASFFFSKGHARGCTFCGMCSHLLLIGFAFESCPGLSEDVAAVNWLEYMLQPHGHGAICFDPSSFECPVARIYYAGPLEALLHGRCEVKGY